MNIWSHIRLAGAVVIIVAAFIHRIDVTFLGLLIQFVGVIGGLNRVERLVEEVLAKLNPEEDDAVR